jgi:hypothetical protein
MPDSPGICMSSVSTSGRVRRQSSIASAPLAAEPTTLTLAAPRASATSRRISAESSQTTAVTRPGVAVGFVSAMAGSGREGRG